MCGIAGIFSADHLPIETLPRLEKMLSALARRGPDGQGVFQHQGMTLGHRRLSIIDLSSRAHQPMVDNALQLAIVFNGTIYNYRELRQTLEKLGYHFFSSGDTEVILKAFHAWGEACLQRFLGMYAFAIWNLAEEKLFLARDLFGIKPLYYSHVGTDFYFASNTQALLATGKISKELDVNALPFHLMLHGVVPAPATILKNIKKLPPAHYAWLEKGQLTTKSYWQLSAKRPQVAITESEWQAELEKRLETAILRRDSAADVPVGILLSGGLDSSLITAMLAKQRPVHTFSIGFEGKEQEAGDEFFYSDQVVERYETKHKKIFLDNRQVLPRLPEAVAAMAEPMVGQDAVAFYLLAEAVSKQVKVVQSGQGADEVFAGYFWYPQMADCAAKNPWQHDPVACFAPFYCDREPSEILAMLQPTFHGKNLVYQWLGERLQESDAETFLDQVLRLDVTALIVDDPVKRVDNMTMAHGLEARVPFLDKEVVEWAAAMPEALKLAEGGKGVLKKIARKYLPSAVIDRPKGYFPVPALKYVEGEFLDFMREILLSKACRERGLLNPDYNAKLLHDPQSHYTKLQGSKLWHNALLELWLQTHLDSV
jgi:asparagine synthase (glutamine-hydrolysing)